MSFDMPHHAPNQSFALAVRDAFERAAEGPQKEIARAHLRAAHGASLAGNEPDWLLGIERAARALA